jgi:hypothetical protein
MKRQPLIEKRIGYTRSTKRVLKDRATFGDIVRLEIVVPTRRRKRKKALRKGEVQAQESVHVRYFEDSGHVRICKKSKSVGNVGSSADPHIESVALIAKNLKQATPDSYI